MPRIIEGTKKRRLSRPSLKSRPPKPYYIAQDGTVIESSVVVTPAPPDPTKAQLQQQVEFLSEQLEQVVTKHATPQKDSRLSQVLEEEQVAKNQLQLQFQELQNKFEQEQQKSQDLHQRLDQKTNQCDALQQESLRWSQQYDISQTKLSLALNRVRDVSQLYERLQREFKMYRAQAQAQIEQLQSHIHVRSTPKRKSRPKLCVLSTSPSNSVVEEVDEFPRTPMLKRRKRHMETVMDSLAFVGKKSRTRRLEIKYPSDEDESTE